MLWHAWIGRDFFAGPWYQLYVRTLRRYWTVRRYLFCAWLRTSEGGPDGGQSRFFIPANENPRMNRRIIMPLESGEETKNHLTADDRRHAQRRQRQKAFATTILAPESNGIVISLSYSTNQRTSRLISIMGNKVSLEDEMVNLRIVSKQMQRSAKKCEKNEKASLDKLKKVRKKKQGGY